MIPEHVGHAVLKRIARISRRRRSRLRRDLRSRPAVRGRVLHPRLIETSTRDIPRGHGNTRGALLSYSLRYVSQHVRMIDEEHPHIDGECADENQDFPGALTQFHRDPTSRRIWSASWMPLYRSRIRLPHRHQYARIDTPRDIWKMS